MDLKYKTFEIDSYSGCTLVDKNDNYYTGKKKAAKAFVYINKSNNSKDVNILLFDLKKPDQFNIEQLIDGTTEEELKELFINNKEWFIDLFNEKEKDPSYNGEM